MNPRMLMRLAAGALVAASLYAADCRFTLADQSSWEGKLGFYLNLENQGEPCRLSTMTLAMGAADGRMWRFIVRTPVWQLGHEYTAKAVVANGLYELYLDGALLSRSGGDFAPFAPDPAVNLSAAFVPGWAGGATDYLVTQTGFTISSSGGKSLAFDLESSRRPMALMLLAPGGGDSAPWKTPAGETWTITAKFRFDPYPDIRALDPHIDRYGQSVYADWPSKIRSDTDLTDAAELESAKLQEWGQPAGYDIYGGLLDSGWNEQPTGFFRLAQRNGMWWLVTPQGNPCFYVGIDTAPAYSWDRTPVTGRPSMFAELPPRTGEPWQDAWGINSWWQNDGTEDIAFNTVNMIRKYGGNWRQVETDLTIRRIHTWGFSGLGKWGEFTPGVPIVPVLDRGGVPVVARHPDVFDPAIQTALRDRVAYQIVPHKTDPFVVGWSLGNEYDEIVIAAETNDILKKASTVPAKRALVDEALKSLYAGDVTSMAQAWHVTASTKDNLYSAAPTPPAADIEYLRRYYARAYYEFVYNTVKQLDPNHLYFGFWIVPGWWENEEDWRLIAPYCDAVGYDRYSDTFMDATLDRLMRETAKPVLLGEFSFPAHYNLMRGFRNYGVSAFDDAESGAKYAQWLGDARRNPFCVGVAWFQYRDEPVSGRGPGQGPDLVYGEDFAFGLVDVGDRPKWDLVERVRPANLEAARARLAFVPPVINQGGAVEAASFAAGAPVAPGSLISIFGTALDGATFRMGGVDVPVLYSSPLQINAQVPWEVAGQASAQLVISSGNAIDVPLATYSPGIFAAVPHDGGAAVKRGRYLTLYCNGLGPLHNQPATGERAPFAPLATTVDTPSVMIGAVPADESFSGLSPDWIGLYQVDVYVRPETPVGTAVPVALKITGLESNTVTVAVE